MRLFRLLMIAVAFAPLAGCADSPTAPEGAIIGRWGGAGAELVADGGSVVVQVVCGRFLARAPLIPDPVGRFLLPLTFVGERSNVPRTLTLRGSVDGLTMTFDVISIASDTTFTSRFTVVRDSPADYSGVACAAAGP